MAVTMDIDHLDTDHSLSEDSLWQAIKSGDSEEVQQARETIVLSYQFLVEAASRKLKTTLPSYILREDLMSYGQIGLLKAVDTYDPSKGSFRSFAYMKIYGAILDELRTQDWAPRGLRREQRQINAAKKDLQEESPSSSAIGERLGWDQTRVDATIRKIENSRHVNLSGVELDNPGGHIFNNDPTSETNLLCETFVTVLESLPHTHKMVIVRRYYLNQTLSTVAEQIEIPLTSVRKMHSEAVAAVLQAMTQAVS